MGESVEIGVLRPECGVVGEGDGVDEGIGEGEFVFDEKICGGNGDVFVDGNDNAGAHGAGDLLGFLRRTLVQCDFSDFGDHDGGDDEDREFLEDRPEMNGIRAVLKAFKPSGAVEDVGLHETGGLDSECAVWLPVELERLIPLEESDELIRGENGADFNFTIHLGELKALARLEVH